MAPKSAPRATYAEIAKTAGVSEATVSRVLNGDENVHPDRSKAVNAAVKKLGYKKHRAASALASGRTGLIAVVIDDDLSIFADPFWATVTSGISRVLMENELQTLLMVTPLESVDGPVAHYLMGGEVDGAIFFQLHKDAQAEPADRDHRYPALAQRLSVCRHRLVWWRSSCDQAPFFTRMQAGGHHHG
jgi:DNA-binding LacI/PurR family transcriptional regulator